MQNVADRHPAPGKRPRHQKATVTVERFAFGAHQADAELRRIGLHRRDRPETRPLAPWPHNRRRRRNRACIARPAAERFAVNEIRDALRRLAATSNFCARTTEKTASTASTARRRRRLTPAPPSSAMNRSIGLLEWPILNRSNAGIAINCRFQGSFPPPPPYKAGALNIRAGYSTDHRTQPSRE